MKKIDELVRLSKAFYTVSQHLQNSEIDGISIAQGISDTTQNIPHCHITRGIEVLAQQADAAIESRSRRSDEYPRELSFVYGGVRFFQLAASESTL